MTKATRMHAVNIRLKQTGFDDFSGRQCCRLCWDVVLSPQSLWPLLASWSVNQSLFDHNHTRGLLNISALHVEYESRHLLNLSVQNAVDYLSENFNLKTFCGEACTQNSPEKCAVRSPDGRYRTHIATVYYIFRPPLSQNPPSAPPWGQRVSALNSEYPLWNVSNWLFREFGCSPYYGGFRYHEVSTWQKLTTRFPNRW